MAISLICILSIVGYDKKEIIGGLYNTEVNSWFGYFGIYVGSFLFTTLLGYYSILICLIAFIFGFSLFANKEISEYFSIYRYILVVSFLCAVLTAFLGIADYSGLLGNSVFIFLYDIFGNSGLAIILLLTMCILISGIFNFSLYEGLNNIFSLLKNFFIKIKNIFTKKSIEIHREELYNEEIDLPSIDKVTPIEDDENKEKSTLTEDEYNDNKGDDLAESISNEDVEQPIIEDEIKVDQGDFEKENKAKFFSYKLPKLDYLSDPIEISNHDNDYLNQKAEYLISSINSFGVSGKVVKISPGPVVTLYEIEPAEGVRVNKFTTLSEDLSRIMGGKRVRIIAPIPGSKSVGVELPNESPSIVYLKSIINSRLYLENKSKLKIALGKTTTGDAFIFELDKMPHLLVAGATGAGKSVCINTIIISILYNAKPNEVKFILMDPKKVELSTYKSLVGYHLITAPNLNEYVMTTSENAVGVLDSAINEMEKRFEIFAEARVRNIMEYHEKRQKDSESLKEIPYIVVIIDELADLMMTSGRAIEEPITRLAQKARAVGIHLIVATQRPSVDVITGLIKSNFPARISFQVSSRIDSRTIIDQIGAEKLLGKGDMLFLLPGSASPIRLHNAYITLDEIEKIMNHITSQSKPEELHLPEIKKVNLDNDVGINSNSDELLHEAAKLVVDYQQASVSLLQRKFRIGYSRAGRLIDELESLGIVTGHSGSKAREVLVDHSHIKEIFND